MNSLLFATVVLSWGFSWYAITLQVGEAPALVALSYRFIMAAGILCGGLVLAKRWRPIPWRDQRWLAGLGFCLFSMNFLSFYLAALYLPSGVLSVIFATAAIFGAINARIFWGTPIRAQVIGAALLGITGLTLLLWPEAALSDLSEVPVWAFVLPFVGTVIFSIGNLISARLSRSYDLPNVIGQGMIWGALILIGLSLLFNQPFILPRSALFWAGEVYLAVIASLLAFLTYLTLVNRIGTDRAAYATVLFPIVAMVVSTYAEGYEWSVTAAIGLALTLGGTMLTFHKLS